MSGIIALAFLGIWFFIAHKLTQFFTSKINLKIKGKWIYPLVFVLVFIAPIADEIIGGFQFRALCTPENLLIYDAEKVRGKGLRGQITSHVMNNRILPIRITQTEWSKPEENEVLITHKILYAGSGWLGHLIGWISSPLTFSGKCDTREYYEMFDKLNIIEIN